MTDPIRRRRSGIGRGMGVASVVALLVLGLAPAAFSAPEPSGGVTTSGGYYTTTTVKYTTTTTKATTTTTKPTTTTTKPTTTTTKPRGDEGCTPGYWKQPHHFDSWVGYSPGDDYEATFGVDASFEATLSQALRQGGGGEFALGRHAVAALLNAANPDVDYAYTTSEVIALVQDAYETGDFEGIKDLLEDANEEGCPLN